MNVLSSEKPLRLWPGVVGAIIVVFARFVIAPFVPGDALIGVLAGTGRCRAHPSLVALLQPRSVVGTDRRGPADRTGRRHDAGLRTSLDRRRHVGEGCCSRSCFLRPSRHSWSRGPSCPGDPRAGFDGRRWRRRFSWAAECGSSRAPTESGGRPTRSSPGDGRRPRRRRLLTAARDETLPSPAAPTAPQPTDSSSAREATDTTAKPRIPAVAPILWSGFRGGERNDAVDGVRINSDWNAAKPAQIWRRRVGPGWSSFAVAGELIFTQEQRGDHELVSAYSLSTRRTGVASPGRGAILRTGWRRRTAWNTDGTRRPCLCHGRDRHRECAGRENRRAPLDAQRGTRHGCPAAGLGVCRVAAGRRRCARRPRLRDVLSLTISRAARHGGRRKQAAAATALHSSRRSRAFHRSC